MSRVKVLIVLGEISSWCLLWLGRWILRLRNIMELSLRNILMMRILYFVSQVTSVIGEKGIIVVNVCKRIDSNSNIIKKKMEQSMSP